MLESLYNMSTEAIIASLGVLASAGGGLSVAVAKLWAWVDKRIQDCEQDRGVLHTKIQDMNTELKTVARTVGQMEGELKQISIRNKTIDDHKDGTVR